MSESERRERPSRRRWALIVLVCLMATALGLFLLRDLPRWWVERRLADRLEAEVSLGRLSILGLQEFRLDEISIRHPGIWPEVQTARVPLLEVQGGIRAILAGRYRLLAFDGLEVTLAPLVTGSVAGEEPGPILTADRTRVRRGEVVLEAEGDRLSCALEAALEDLGRDAQGELKIRCDRLTSKPILSFLHSRATDDTTPPPPPLAGAPDDLAVETADLEADVRVGATASGLAAQARVGGVHITAKDRSVDLGSLFLEFTPDSERSRVEIRTASPVALAESIRATLWLDPALQRWTRVVGQIDDLQLTAAHELASPHFSDWAVEGVADIDLVGEPETGVTVSGRAALGRLSRAGVDQPLRGAELRFESHWLAPDRQPRATVTARLDVPLGAGDEVRRNVPGGLLPLSAQLEGEWDAAENRFSASHFAIHTARLGDLTASGLLRGLTEVPELSADWTWTGTSLVNLVAAAGPAADQLGEAVQLHGSLRGCGDLRGSPLSPSARATLRLDGLWLASAAARESAIGSRDELTWVLEAQPFETVWSRVGGKPAIALSIPRIGGTFDLAGHSSVPFELTAQARIDPGGTIDLESAELTTPGLGWGHLGGTLSASGSASLGLRWSEGDVAAWLGYLEPSLGAVPDDLKVHGQAGLEMTMHRDAAGSWRSEGSLSLTGGGFEAEEGSRVLEGLRLETDLTGHLMPMSALEVTSRTRIGGFQILWGTLFGDYSGREVELAATVAANRSPEGSGWSWGGDVHSQLAGASTLEVRLAGGSGDPTELTATASIGDLGEFLAQYLVKPLQGSVGRLDQLQATGSLNANFTTSARVDTRTASGSLEVAGLAARTAGGLEIEGLDLRLPFDLAWIRTSADDEPTITGPELLGWLRFGALSTAGLTLPASSANLLVRGDSVTLAESLAVRLLGGRVDLDRLTLSEILQPSRHVTAALRLAGIQLAEISRSQGWVPLEGEVTGLFPAVQLTNGTLHVDGGGTVSVFGGAVSVGEISGADIFSDYPRVTLSADFRDIDLAQLTHKLGFGEITGTIDGAIRDLELFRGTPVRFRARLASRRRPGVPQTVGFRAIDNLAMLGGGGSVGALDLGIPRFFDHFPYRRLGVAMVLDRDHFLLHGLEQRGNRELFIKGRPPVRLDMVNVQPGRTVSFRTMLDRIDNLEITKKPIRTEGS